MGGAGFLGSNLVRRCLSDDKNRVTVVDSLDPRLKSSIENLQEVRVSIEFIEGDIRDSSLMESVVEGKEVIFNCAGQTSHPISLSDPLFDVEINCAGNLRVLEAVRKCNKDARIIYTSSSTVIGKAMGDTITETHSEYPLDIYSANKCVAEKYYYIYHKVHGLKTLSLRFANLYGPYGKGYPEFGFINYFIWLAANNQEISIFGDGSQTRNVMYVEDVTDLLYNCVFHDSLYGDVYFAVHKEHYSVLDIAREIVSVFGTGRLSKKRWPRVRKRIEIGDAIISGAKLYYETQWEPKFNLREGLIKTKQIMERSPEGIGIK
ncbi:MAG: NAD-dependent epimerase/dehydratase family protein [Candidatus Aminicenantes bacterium]|nr:NAD-dependent epimerase/dehydratase family protein [Candidatus Aminicenantes bacterium]